MDGPGSDNRYRRRRLDDFEAIMRAAGARVSRAALERGYDRSAEFLNRLWRRRRDVGVADHVWAILHGADASLPARLGQPTLQALADAYARPAVLVPPAVDDGARPALEVLAGRGYTLALVSNTMRTPGVALRKLLAHYGLLPCFAHTTFSDEVGVRKPDPEIFALTLRAVGGEPGTAVHVGDDPVLDVDGARAAGMRVIHLARPGASAAGAPDVRIAKLSALPEAIERLDSRD